MRSFATPTAVEEVILPVGDIALLNAPSHSLSTPLGNPTSRRHARSHIQLQPRPLQRFHHSASPARSILHNAGEASVSLRHGLGREGAEERAGGYVDVGGSRWVVIYPLWWAQFVS